MFSNHPGSVDVNEFEDYEGADQMAKNSDLFGDAGDGADIGQNNALATHQDEGEQ